VARPEREELQVVGAGLERARDPGRDADRVERLHVDDVVIELQPARAREHDVNLLRVVVPVREALALSGPETMQADAGVLEL
jgi:hypothetical protein